MGTISCRKQFSNHYATKGAAIQHDHVHMDRSFE